MYLVIINYQSGIEYLAFDCRSNAECFCEKFNTIHPNIPTDYEYLPIYDNPDQVKIA